MRPPRRVEVHTLDTDPRLRPLNDALQAAAIPCAVDARVDLYDLDGDLTPHDLRALADLLASPPLQRAVIDEAPDASAPLPPHALEIAPRPGVTDRPAASLLRAAARLLHRPLRAVARSRRLLLRGDPDAFPQAAAHLHHPLIARAALGAALPSALVLPPPPPAPLAQRIPLRDLDDDALRDLGAARRLALDDAELRAAQRHFRDLGRDPTDLELEMIAQTWSEHCVHKTFKAEINYKKLSNYGEITHQERIDGLLATFIQAATAAAAKPWLRSAFEDNAGRVALCPGWEIAAKVETHNRPSALEPFGGAHTGIGGVVRDILGVSALPIANLDALCFGPLDLPADDLPPGALHPRRVRQGVLAGIADYGNTLGVPTVAGAILYDPGYVANPLVFCGCLGVLPEGAHPRRPQPGDWIVALGAATGRDGLRGATFSSLELGEDAARHSGGAVQIGDPLEERLVIDAVLAARDAGLYTAITDCGAGGFSSAIGELAAGLGAEIELDAAPLKYAGLAPWEIWLSESQERMVLAVPPDAWDALEDVAARCGTQAVRLGRLCDHGRLILRSQGQRVGDLALDFLHHGLPRRRLEATWRPPTPTPLTPPPEPAWADDLLRLLASPDGASREGVLRRFDHEVQGGTLGRPLVGAASAGPGDGVVLLPLPLQDLPDAPGVAVGLGLNPRYGALDPWRMALAAVDEAARNVVATGADPDHLSLLDNFCWGNPTLPDRLGALVECARGCRDGALAYQAPFISGKDSLNNEHLTAQGERRAIPGTVLITAVAAHPHPARAVEAAFQADGGRIYLLGETFDELGGAAWAHLHGQGRAGEAPLLRPGALRAARALHQAMRAGLVQACHDCAEGGAAVALAELCLSGDRGAHVRLDLAYAAPDLPPHALLFSESLSRYLIEVAPDDAPAFEALLCGLPLACIGEVGGRSLRIDLRDATALDLDVDSLRDAFQRGPDGPCEVQVNNQPGSFQYES